MKNRKGFTVVEYMIVFVIVGLLAAMAIPAFQKVKVSTLAKQVASGGALSANDEEFLKNHISSIPTEMLPRIPREYGGTKDQIFVVPQSIRFDQTIILNGKTYGLVPLN
jgi:prepilin-type N-terminal cleavage/methylation domain-containing protein